MVEYYFQINVVEKKKILEIKRSKSQQKKLKNFWKLRDFLFIRKTTHLWLYYAFIFIYSLVFHNNISVVDSYWMWISYSVFSFLQSYEINNNYIDEQWFGRHSSSSSVASRIFLSFEHVIEFSNNWIICV